MILVPLVGGTFSLDEKYRSDYVNGLIQIEDFKTLIDFVLSDLSLDDEEKKLYLTKAVCGIFTSFHYSTKSFSFFYFILCKSLVIFRK